MAKCFSFTASRDRFYRFSFSAAGLKSITTDIGDGTVIHSWVPKTHNPQNPTLLLIHGIGANAMWQWNNFVARFSRKFNVYVPDLLFFGDSHTSRPERSELFQAQCLMRALEILGVKKMRAVGLSYGGFVAYSMAAQFPDAVEMVVIGCAGVCVEERDMENGMFVVKNLDEGIDILLARTPQKLRQLLKFTFYKPLLSVPSCFLSDFITVMCCDYYEERKELIYALYKDRKLSQLPKINQPTLVLWGDHDQIFPLELAHRLVSHLENKAKLVVLKNAGHAINIEKKKELYNSIKSFLTSSPEAEHSSNANSNAKVEEDPSK